MDTDVTRGTARASKPQTGKLTGGKAAGSTRRVVASRPQGRDAM